MECADVAAQARRTTAVAFASALNAALVWAALATRQPSKRHAPAWKRTLLRAAQARSIMMRQPRLAVCT
ncbi:hypothetical protein OAO87_02600 [bacterium]|nr:hypothetical protein [bacterium]